MSTFALIDDDFLWEEFARLSERLAQGKAPEEIAAAIALGRMTALLKNDEGKVRGIVAGNTLRRAVARTLPRQFAEAITDATAPFQFALQTRAGTVGGRDVPGLACAWLALLESTISQK